MLITGTRRGIGQHLAAHYLANGYAVVGCSRGPASVYHASYTHFELDVSDEKAVRRLFSHLRKQHGRLDVLINNAGLYHSSLVMLTDSASVERVMETNLKGVFLLCREACKLMKKNQFGRIVQFSSIAVPLDTPGNALYSASKAAVEQFSQVLAAEVFPLGITVNTLGLSIVEETGMAEQIPPEAAAQTLERTISGETLRLQDVAHAVDFFIHPRSSTVTAQTLYLGGVPG
jgi:3-oxoacyl-[acyl-carrier protein] reductase